MDTKESEAIQTVIPSDVTESDTTETVPKVTDEEVPTHEQDTNDGWTDILGNGLLKKRVLTPGSGERPQSGQRITIQCQGRLDDGTEVDKQDELTFALQEIDVITGFDLAAALMLPGEQAELIVDSKYAYGPIGRDPDIPPDATITYAFTLVRVEDAVDVEKIPLAERIQLGDKKRERGNYLFSRDEHSFAISVYSLAIKLLDNSYKSSSDKDIGDTEELQRMLDVQIKCYNNLGAAQLKVEAYDAAIKSCDSVLKYQPDNVKALFRKGKACYGLGEFTKGEKLLRQALKLDPESKIVHSELSRVMYRRKKEQNKEKEMYQKMLGTKHLASKTTRNGASFDWAKWGMAIGAVAAGLLSAAAMAYRSSMRSP